MLPPRNTMVFASVPSRPARLESDDVPGDYPEADALPAEMPSDLIGTDIAIIEAEDGSGDAEIVLDDDPRPHPDSLPFDGNLADAMDPQELGKIAQELIDAVEHDLASATNYRKIVEDGMVYLGLKYEDRTWPFPQACGTFDTMMLEAIVRQQATECGELLPGKGPVLTQVLGMENKALQDQAWRVRHFMNWFLTEVAEEYYPDSDKLSWAKACWGSVFRKVYFDPRLGRPTARYLTPRELIVNYGARDLKSAQRTTEIIRFSQRDMVGLQLSGFYRDIELGEPDEDAVETAGIEDKQDTLIGITKDQGENDDRFTVLEIHCDLDLLGFEHKTADMEATGWALPYVITIELNSRKVLAIRRNWKLGDPLFQKVAHYVHHEMIPGDGFYAHGFIHLLYGTTRATTMMLRQNVDAGTLGNFPGGLRVKGVRTESSSLQIGPMQFVELETGGLRIQDAVMAMPYKGANEITMLMRKSMREEAQSLAATADLAVGDGRQDAPVGTTVALLEQAMKVQSAIMKRARRSYRDEFRIFARLFAECLPDVGYPFPVKGSNQFVVRQDFDHHIDVIPVADPNVSSATQRQLKNELVLKTIASFPEIGADQRAAVYTMFDDMDVSNIDQVLPPPEEAKPLDPISENQFALVGKPLVTAPWQNHVDHITVHAGALQATGMASHVQDHLGQYFRQQIEQALGMPLPPLGAELPPEVQNQIATLAAKAMQVVKQQQQQGAMDPAAIALEQIKVDAQEVQNKLNIARMKDATERQKALWVHEDKLREIASKEITSRLKAWADVADNRQRANPDAERVLTQ